MYCWNVTKAKTVIQPSQVWQFLHQSHHFQFPKSPLHSDAKSENALFLFSLGTWNEHIQDFYIKSIFNITCSDFYLPKIPSVLLQASSILQYWTFKLHVFIFFSSIYNPWDILQQHSFERKNLLTRNIMFFNMIPRALIKARLKTLSRHRIRSQIINKQWWIFQK